MWKNYSLYILINILLTSCEIAAQTPGAMQSSNYGGIVAVQWQPASLADNRIETEIFLGGFQADLWNNHFGLATSLLRSSAHWDSLDTPTGFNPFLFRQFDGRDKFFHGEASAIGPGIMVTLPRGTGFSITSRFRNLLSVRNVNELLLKDSYDERDIPEVSNLLQNGLQMSVNAVSFFELSAATGFIIHESDQYVLKTGIGLKYLSGFAGLSFHSEEANLEIIDTTTVSFSDVDMHYAYSNSVPQIPMENPLEYLFQGNNGWAVDLGFIFEIKDPEASRGFRPELTRYKFKAGISLLDAGRLSFGSPAVNLSFSGQADSVNPFIQRINSIRYLDDFLLDNFPNEKRNRAFAFSLPTRLGIHLDYRYKYGLSASLMAQLNLQSEGFARIPGQNVIALVPRWEKRDFEIAASLSWQEFESLYVGTSVRLGPVFVGVNNLWNILTAETTRGISIFAGVRAYFPYKAAKTRQQGSSIKY